MTGTLAYSIIEAPSILGLRPTGVKSLPQTLKQAGLIKRLNAKFECCIQPIYKYDSKRDPLTLIKNGQGIKVFSIHLAKIVNIEMAKKRFPILLGGDCSILIGALLGLRRVGGFGLFFIDGHADFYQPQASVTGEVADMDLAIVMGRGPDILTNIDGLKPLLLDREVVVFGYRDAKQSSSYGSQDVKNTNIQVFDLWKIKKLNISNVASVAVSNLLKEKLDGFWIHLDTDVLNDKIMPAVDYRLDDGLEFSELSELLKILISSQKAVGMTITIFNPHLDPHGSIARNFVSSIVSGLSL